MQTSTILYLTLFSLLATLLCYWHFCRPKTKSAAVVAAAAPGSAPAGQKASAGADSLAGT